METVTLPDTDLCVSRLCFGCWGIVSDLHWGRRDEGQAVAALHAALDAGVNFFDTAAVYGEGTSERLLGKVLAGRRGRVIIASKIRPDRMRPAEVVRCCEQSLQRLGTD
jgi:aryl-alcohol dehydrogenase-like predicted oxidoreductase